LKRRLAEEGSDYTTLLDEHRHGRALSLLASPESTIDAVAERLGYSDVANFSRAFRRWTGVTPAAWRKSRPTR
jgi:AraC-like DNA-binding protein